MKSFIRDLMVTSLVIAGACAHADRQSDFSTGGVELTDAADAASADDSSAPPSETDNGWPRTATSGSDQITIYQPQIESWQQNQLQARAAVSVQRSGSPQPVYGVVWFSARTEVDKENRLVTLEDVQLTKTSFPSEPQSAEQYAAAIGPQLSQGIRTIALDRLQASLSVTQAEEKQATVAVKNDPPRILYSATRAILILIDGKPILRNAGTNLLRVINTRALMLLDSSSGTYYFYLANRWMQAPEPTGPWTQAPNAPSSLDTAKAAATKDKLVDLLDTPGSPLLAELQRGTLPTIYVSTSPAELMQTQGKAQLQPISGTQLLQVTNTDSDLFLDEAGQRYFVLISGRWYQSPSLDQGSWAYVPPKELPADFAQIPENHPKGSVLAAVSGTPQAQEAVIANQIPQTATISKTQAQPKIEYDGAPDWRPVCNTSLVYAFNSATPVIRLAPNSYYAVDSGIWFNASSPTGPWAVAISVPPVIYTIPPCAPIYHVTHVYVYGSTPEYVYTGYTPGYLGSYVSPESVVVFGTGYVYPPWVGTVWVGAPVTFGYDVHWGLGFGWGFGWGFAGFGVGFGYGLFHPWWGPYGWGWGHRNIVVNNIHVNNIYRRSWNRNVVVNRGIRRGFGNRIGPARGGPGRNSVFAGRDGHAYRNSGSSWQRFDRGGWHAAPSGPQSPAHELGRENAARSIGQSHVNAFRGGGGFHGVGGGGFRGGGFHGGGFHGGGGRR